MAKKIGELVVSVSFTVPVTKADAAYMAEEGLTTDELAAHAKNVMAEVLQEVDSDMENLVIETEYREGGSI